MNNKQKTILIAGGSGLIGHRLTELLTAKNYKVNYLTRDNSGKSTSSYIWDPEKKIIDKDAISSADVIINLAGTSIAGKRWTTERKKQIIDSRINSTNLLSESLKNIPNHVSLIINASAIGIYGDTGEQVVYEDSQLENDFLGKTCKQWESAAMEFTNLNKRTVIFRIGLVLTNNGGMLPEISKSLPFGIGFIFGSGRQYQSWIHIDDLCGMFIKAIEDESIYGVFNAVAPTPVTNSRFMKILTEVRKGQQILLPVPSVFLKILLGEMSKIILISSNVSSRKIEATGYKFIYPQLNLALKNLLNK